MKAESNERTGSKWARRAGIITFLFFLAKGLVWLGIAAAGAYYAFN
jgi:hypothetical protein